MKKRDTIFLTLLIASNLFPLFGIFFLHWNTFSIYFIYIVESIVLTALWWTLILLKLFITRQSYLLSSLLVLILATGTWFAFFFFPFMFLISDSMESTQWLMTIVINSMQEVKIWVILICLLNAIKFTSLLNLEDIKSLNDVSMMKNIIFRMIFWFLVFIIALSILSYSGEFFENKNSLVAALVIISFQSIYSVTRFIFSLKSPQKILPS